jgi:hypothetical protein
VDLVLLFLGRLRRLRITFWETSENMSLSSRRWRPNWWLCSLDFFDFSVVSSVDQEMEDEDAEMVMVCQVQKWYGEEKSRSQ